MKNSHRLVREEAQSVATILPETRGSPDFCGFLEIGPRHPADSRARSSAWSSRRIFGFRHTYIFGKRGGHFGATTGCRLYLAFRCPGVLVAGWLRISCRSHCSPRAAPVASRVRDRCSPRAALAAFDERTSRTEVRAKFCERSAQPSGQRRVIPCLRSRFRSRIPRQGRRCRFWAVGR